MAMKENEAPKKLYLFENPITNEADDRWLSSKSFEKDIEYIRTDVFIERVCNAYCKVCKMPNCRRNECKMIDSFKKYIEE